MIRKIIRKFKPIHNVIKAGYRMFNKAGYWLKGTKHIEKKWEWRYNKTSLIFEKEQQTNNSHHKKLFMKEIERMGPIESALEIGCGVGTNLLLIKEQYPHCILEGVDINEKAINEGKKYFKNHKIREIIIKKNKADDIYNYKDNSFDVVFTVATMMYIGTDKINEIIESMIRIAKKRILFVEMYTDNKSFYDGEHWIHNYIKLCKKKGLKKEKINLFKKGDMNDDCWDKCGAIITIIKS